VLGKKNPTPLDGVSLILSDLDGVIYKGPDAIPHAVESLLATGLELAYLTNNASRTPDQVAEQLRGYGLPATPHQVVTSPQAAVKLLATLIPNGSLVLVVGGVGLTSELEAAGYRITRSAKDKPVAVVQGFAPEVGWEQLAQASFALQRDEKVLWVATNTDWTIPVKDGVAPGNGAMVSAVHLAVGRLATFAGKPETPMFDVAIERFQPSGTALMIGDRLDTDILGANRAGIASALVLTGIDTAKQLLAADVSAAPTYVLGDLRELSEPYPVAEGSVDKNGVHTVMVGDAVVSRNGHVIRVVSPGDPLDRLRAGAKIVYDSGLKIFGLDVDPQIYSEL
jgi:HAD superfamily hydrolase (TIGR01450 family)